MEISSLMIFRPIFGRLGSASLELWGPLFRECADTFFDVGGLEQVGKKGCFQPKRVRGRHAHAQVHGTFGLGHG
jgi:hypothetical protein